MDHNIRWIKLEKYDIKSVAVAITLLEVFDESSLKGIN